VQLVLLQFFQDQLVQSAQLGQLTDQLDLQVMLDQQVQLDRQLLVLRDQQDQRDQ
jgi:hypothetical protein